MARRNIGATKRALEESDSIDRATLDGTSNEAIFRAIIDIDPDQYGVPDDVEELVEELPVEINTTKFLGHAYGLEVELK